MINAVIVTSREPFRIKWNEEPFCGNDIRLFLITSSFCMLQHKIDEQAKCFKEVVVINSLKKFTVDGLTPYLKNILNTYGTNTLLATHDEYMLLTLSKLREKFNLKGNRIEDLVLFRNKLLMKEAAKKHGFLVPNYLEFFKKKFLNNQDQYLEKVIKQLSLPLIAKPILEARCRDIELIKTRKALLSWCKKQKDDSRTELEQYIQGSLYNCFIVIINNKVEHFGVMKYAYPCLEFLTKKNPLGGIIIPSTDSLFHSLQQYCNNFIESLGELLNFSGQIEVFKTKNEKLFLLEIAARPPGAVITDIYEKHSGIHLEKVHYQMQLHQKVMLVENIGGNTAWCWYPKPVGTVIEFKRPKIKSDYDLIIDADKGDTFDGSHFLGDRIYSINEITNSDYTTLKRDFNFLISTFTPYKLAGD